MMDPIKRFLMAASPDLQWGLFAPESSYGGRLLAAPKALV